MDQLVDDLGAVIQRVSAGRGPAIVVGESFGGALAISLSLSRPELVQGLVVINSFPYFAPQWRLWLAIHGLGVLPWGAMPLVRRLTAFRMHSRHTHHEDLKHFVRLTTQATKHGYVGRLRLLQRYDVREHLHQIVRPTLFLASDLDHLVPAVQQAQLMRTRVPGSALQVLRGHGHICLIAPDLYLDEIIAGWQTPQGQG